MLTLVPTDNRARALRSGTKCEHGLRGTGAEVSAPFEAQLRVGKLLADMLSGDGQACSGAVARITVVVAVAVNITKLQLNTNIVLIVWEEVKVLVLLEGVVMGEMVVVVVMVVVVGLLVLVGLVLIDNAGCRWRRCWGLVVIAKECMWLEVVVVLWMMAMYNGQ